MSCDIRRGRDNYDFAIGVNDSVASSPNWFNSICDRSQMNIMRTRKISKNITLVKGEVLNMHIPRNLHLSHPKDKPLGANGVLHNHQHKRNLC